MDISIFSFSINIFKSLLKLSHNIESVLTSSIFLPRKSAISNPFDLSYRFQDMLQNKKATWRWRHNDNNRFFHLLKEKNAYPLNNWNNHFYSNDSKKFHTTQTTVSLIQGNNDRNLLWEHNPDNYILSLSWNIHTNHLHSTTSTTSS